MPRFEYDFNKFTGGLNTVSSNDQLAESEFPALKNVELGDRGSLSRRSGMVKYFEPETQGKGQGFFRLFRKAREPLEVFAVNGFLYQRPTDVITLDGEQPYEFERAEVFTDSEGNDVPCRIVKVKIGNAKPSSLPVQDINNPIHLTPVSSITGKDQMMIDLDRYLLVSLADSETDWSTTPDIEAIKKVFFLKKIKVFYTVNNVRIDIDGLPNGFQKIRPIEAVQYKDKLYLATGSRFCEFNGVTAKIVEPHKPDPLEALYVGTNALADDPSNFMNDGLANDLRIDGVTSTMRVGVVNKATTLKIYVSKPASAGTIQYKYMQRKVGATTFTLARDWSNAREFDFVPSEIGDYEFDCYARDSAATTKEVRFIVPKYSVKERDTNEKIDFEAIQRCNRILVHWERLVLYGDDTNSSMIFVSHLQKADFFPTPNTLRFDNKQIEALTALVRYRDMLVAFTPTSIQALYGKSPDEYSRVSLNSSIGCIAPYSAHVTGNYITFLTKDGVYILDSVGYTEEKANVTKIDQKVANVIYKDSNACAIVSNSQYQLYYPERNSRMRMYYEEGGAWTYDESEKMDFVTVNEWDGIVYGQSIRTGAVLKFDKSVFNDDGFVYEDRIETKEMDFGQPYAKKKIKQVKFLLRSFDKPVNLSIMVYADTTLIVNPEQSHAYVDPADGEVKWLEEFIPNITIRSGTVFGSWELGRDTLGMKDSDIRFIRVSGRCRRTRIIISHREDTPNSLLGFGYALVMAQGQTQGAQATGTSASAGTGGTGGTSGGASK